MLISFYFLVCFSLLLLVFWRKKEEKGNAVGVSYVLGELSRFCPEKGSFAPLHFTWIHGCLKHSSTEARFLGRNNNFNIHGSGGGERNRTEVSLALGFELFEVFHLN